MTIAESAIFAVVTDASVIFVVVIAESESLAVFTTLFAIVSAPSLLIVASPLMATPVATLEALPTQIWADVSELVSLVLNTAQFVLESRPLVEELEIGIAFEAAAVKRP